MVVWFTGLSGSGKTTLAKKIVPLLEKRGMKVEYLDGDVIRELIPNTGFTSAERKAHILRMGLLAHYLEKHGVCVVAGFISPHEEARQHARKLCREFVEIHVSTPLDVCEKRDVKGLYAKARAGAIPHFTGIDEEYEMPKNPELRIDTSKVGLDEAVRIVLETIDKKKAR